VTSSLSLPNPAQTSIRTEWSVALGTRLRGLALAREKGWLLTWDDDHWLGLFDPKGDRRGQVRAPAALTAACTADDGSAHVAVGNRGEVWWLAPDLSVRWERTVGQKAIAVAVDPFGQYAAVADGRGSLHLFDRRGRTVGQAQTPRPLHHLAFVPAATFLLGSADYGLVGCFDLSGRCAWRDGLVAHVGSLAVNGDGTAIVLACFSEGLQRYTLAGKNLGRLSLAEPARLAALDFESRSCLVAGLSNQLLLVDRDGRTVASHVPEAPPVGIVLGALGRTAAAALADGTLVGLDLRAPARS
jgi:hypothetical protein